MHNLIPKKKCGNFWSNDHEENLASKIYFLWGCNSSMMSHGGQLQKNFYVNDTLHQQTSTIPPVKRQNSTDKSRIGSSTLTSRAIATKKELRSWKSEGICEEMCPLEECNNYSYLQILLIMLPSFI